MNIIVVDDDYFTIKLVSTALQEAGYAYECFKDGEEATDALDMKEYDVLITDICMPQMDGLELMRNTRQKFKDDIFIIAMTAGGRYLPKDVSLSSARLYANIVMEKPFEKADLIAAIESSLSSSSKTPQTKPNS